MIIKNFIARSNYQNLQLTNFTNFTMVDKTHGGASSLQDLKVELQNKVLSTDESLLIYGGRNTKLDNFSFNGCGGMIPQ